MPEDPMKERDRARMRRNAADMLHALARKIEFGDHEVISLSLDFEAKPDPSSPPCAPQDIIYTGNETMTVYYKKNPAPK